MKKLYANRNKDSAGKRNKDADGVEQKAAILKESLIDGKKSGLLGSGEGGKKGLRFEEDIVREIREDYVRRGQERRHFEAQWQLNRNFVGGNHYCHVSFGGAVEESGKDYFWQEREVYNHIAPIVETRLAKLMKVRPKMSVVPASGDDSDIKTAKVATKILDSCYHKLALDTLINKAAMWSEITGTVLYKISWQDTAGRKVGESKDGNPIFEGDVVIDICPPYEVYPDSISAQDIADCVSIIHAKAMHIDEIERIWGQRVAQEETVFTGHTGSVKIGGMCVNSSVPTLSQQSGDGFATVIERYVRPTAAKPNGELAIVAGDKLLYFGELPYLNGVDGGRDLPFVKQDSIINAGCFYGVSVIERAIPIQRAYNAVKNRKHEFLNRISMGVLAVEDGSVDIDNLEEEGLSPGKILVYRQGSTPPRLMETGRVPIDFSYEEDKLLNEFISLSGVSEIMRSSSLPSSVNSGLAIQLLLDQDDNRLATTAERIRDAVKNIGKQVLRLYKQFAGDLRLSRFVGENGEVEIISWQSSDISCDDVVLDTENELSTSKAARQNMIFELLRAGLLQDENGKLSDNARGKVLEALDFGNLEIVKDVERMHGTRASRENFAAVREDISPEEIDEHSIHIKEHTRFLLDDSFQKLKKKHPQLEEKIVRHIREHRSLLELAQIGEKA